MYEKESIDYKGMSIKIYYDEDPASPREWDNLGTIYSNHRDYNPDGHKIDELFNEDGQLNEKELDKNYIWLPIYAYIHSGITISTGHGYPYNDRWDSGLFGIIAVSKNRVRGEYACKSITAERRKKVEELLKCEIETLDQYFTGQVYGFIVEDKDESHVDSCFGYFGDKGIKDAIEEAKSVIDCELRRRLSSHIAKRKAQIKSHAPFYARTAFAF